MTAALTRIAQTLTELCTKHWLPVFLVMLCLFTLMRSLRITADAPAQLSVSAGLFTDEGFKTLSSKNRVLYGKDKWTPEDQYYSWHAQSPLPVYLYEKIFTHFGFGLASIRYVHVIVSALTMCVLFFFVRSRYDIITAFISFFIFGISHFSSMYQRLGFFENFLSLFSLIAAAALFKIVDFIKILKCRTQTGTVNRVITISAIITLALFAILSFSCGIKTKLSIMILPFSLLPFVYLYYMYSRHKMNAHVTKHFYLIIVLIALFYFTIAHFSIVNDSLEKLISYKLFGIRIGNIMPLRNSASNFYPFYLTFANALLMEFAHIQPVIFFTAALFALFVYHEFLYSQKLQLNDLIFASWFLFGFLFLTLLKYHPSRYYILLMPPLSILSARFFCNQDRNSFVSMLHIGKHNYFRKITSIFFQFYFLYNAATASFMLLVPLGVRKKIYDLLYFSLSSGKYTESIPSFAILIVWLAAAFSLMIPLFKYFPGVAADRKFYLWCFTLMCVLQCTHYAKWILFSENAQYELSTQISESFEPNAVLAGSWSAGLTVENTLRPMVLQEHLNYNRKVIKKIIANKPLKVHLKDKDTGKSVTVLEKNIPLYLTVSKNGTFDGKMRKVYSKYMTDNNLVAERRLGYFDIVVYRIPRRSK